MIIEWRKEPTKNSRPNSVAPNMHVLSVAVFALLAHVAVNAMTDDEAMRRFQLL